MNCCPPIERLQILLSDDPSGPDAMDLASHLQDCTRCQQQLEQLTRAANRPANGSGLAGSTEPAHPYEPDAGFLAQLRQSYSLLKALPETAEEQDTSCSGLRRGRPAGDAPLPHLAGYEILEEIGRGGTGVVYKARQVSLGRLVALKMLLDGPHAAAEQLTRFRREAEAIARLHHPNIVQIYEVGSQSGRPFFSMEYVAAGSLAHHLAGTPQDSRSAAQLVRTLAQAIHAAHRQGIVHRDLKPANILLQREGTAEDAEDRKSEATSGLPMQSSASSAVKYCTPKITDFGLVKILESAACKIDRENKAAAPSAGPQTRTQTGAILGTPSYMAPEQAQANASAIGPAADVYALGAILYELVTGRPAFKAATTLDTVLQVLHADPVPPRRFQPTVPRDLETICLKCLHKEPPRRYTDARDLSEDLGRFLAGEPIRARPVAWWERVKKWAHRRPASAALIGVSALAVLGLLLGGLWHNNRLAEAFLREQSERDRADRVVQEALDTMSRLVRVDSDMPGGAQTQAFRRKLGEEVGTFYQKLLADTALQGQSVRQRVGSIHYDLGLIHREGGQPDLALKHFRQARDLQEQLVAAYPENPEYRADLALTYVNLVGLFSEPSQRAQAEELLGKARDYCLQLTRQEPEVARYQGMLAQCYNNLGCLYLQRPDELAKAREAFERAVAVGERSVQDHPDLAPYQVALAGHHINLILVYQGLGKPDQAAASADKAAAILEAATRDYPHELTYAHRLGSCYINRGYLAITAGKPDKALDSYQRAVNILEALQTNSPGWKDIRTDLASAHGGQADALVQLNRPAESLPHWRRLLELDEGPNNDLYRLRYSLALVQTGAAAAAAAEAQKLTAHASGEMRFNLACVYSLCCRTVRGGEKISGPDRERLAENYAVQAIQLLRKAAAAGLFNSPVYREHLRQDIELTPIRSRPDFQDLLRETENRTP